MTLTSEILDLLGRIRTKPATVLPFQEATYEVVSTYIDGYFRGILHATGRNVNKNIIHWNEHKVKKIIPATLSTYIKYKYKHVKYRQLSDEKLISILIDNIENYFKYNPNWHNEDITPLPFNLGE